MIELANLILTAIGAGAVGGLATYLLYGLGVEIKRIHRVAKHYDDLCDHDVYFGYERDYFKKVDKDRRETKDRLYRVEHRTDRIEYQSLEHMDVFKHIKKAKKRVKK